MSRVYQINILEAGNGFIVQSPTGDQMVAKDEAEVQEAVKQLVTKLLNAPPSKRGGRQTIIRSGEPIKKVQKHE